MTVRKAPRCEHATLLQYTPHHLHKYLMQYASLQMLCL